ncbi:MAG: heme biosynthesis HemY N-terminal domain-containing protein [Devosia sp.]
MVAILVFLTVVVLAASGAAWLADHPGTVSYDWMGTTGTLSILDVAILAAGLMVATLVLAEIVLAGIRGPRRRRQRRQAQNLKRGVAAFSDALIALAAGERRTAERQGLSATRLLPDAPAVDLLNAQLSQLAGDGEGAKGRFQALSREPETQLVGLRGLHVEALRAGDLPAARAHARAAHALDGTVPWAAQAAFDAATAERNWTEAFDVLERNLKARIIDKGAARRLRAVLLTAEARDCLSHDRPRAGKLALEAHGLAKDLVPAAVTAADALGEKSRRQAESVLEETFRVFPHPEIASAHATLPGAQTGQDAVRRAGALANLAKGHLEGALALAKAALTARQFDAAREALRPFLDNGPPQRVCALMAEIEAAQHGDEARVRLWLIRALKAPRDPVWIADGVVSAEWDAVSPVTGVLDRYEWRIPYDGVAAATVIDLTALGTDAAAALPARSSEDGHDHAHPSVPVTGP